jgi:hypothetical protein
MVASSGELQHLPCRSPAEFVGLGYGGHRSHTRSVDRAPCPAFYVINACAPLRQGLFSYGWCALTLGLPQCQEVTRSWVENPAAARENLHWAKASCRGGDCPSVVYGWGMMFENLVFGSNQALEMPESTFLRFSRAVGFWQLEREHYSRSNGIQVAS